MGVEEAMVVRGVTDQKEAKVAGEVKAQRTVKEELHHGINQRRKEEK